MLERYLITVFLGISISFWNYYLFVDVIVERDWLKIDYLDSSENALVDSILSIDKFSYSFLTTGSSIMGFKIITLYTSYLAVNQEYALLHSILYTPGSLAISLTLTAVGFDSTFCRGNISSSFWWWILSPSVTTVECGVTYRTRIRYHYA